MTSCDNSRENTAASAAQPRPHGVGSAARCTTTTAPPRPSSPTNLGRLETAWRSRTLTVDSLEVTIDLSGAPGSAATFSVRSDITLTVLGQRSAQGLWVDFVGQEVTGLSLNGVPQEVCWDGARVSLPVTEPGEHRVCVDAVGLYSNSGQGLHRFHDPVDDRTYLYTHFEPSDARRAWPVLDQPDLKAPFSLVVVHPQEWTVLSNASQCVTQPSEHLSGASVSRFEATLPLPSYLTALAAGPWHRVSGQWRPRARPEESVPLSWSCRQSLAQHLDAEELLEVTRAGMDLYDEAYAFPYPWGAYDNVLVPEYNLGAMENPGCVTFNEDAYLFQGPVTRAQHAGRANTILHEMCHMWFGDLVTPRWWEDTWLKESFAENQGTWAQASATQFTDAWVSFTSSRKAWAYLEDSRPSTTHPVVASVEDVETARQTFDGITYAKGAAVLKQLAAHLGQETFQEAARAWFRGHAFANADLAEFLSTLSEVSGRDMDTWADAWLRTSGPSVITDEVETDGGVITSLALTQQGTDPLTGQEVLRPHTLMVGLYSFDAEGALTRTSCLNVDLDCERVEVSQALGLPAPDLVTVNDEDLTYAVIRPDAASLATARQALGRVRSPMARALWWSAMYNLVRDALLSPQAFTETVLSQAGDDTDPATLSTLLAQCLSCATIYASPADRAERLSPLVTGAAHDLLLSAPEGDDAQLVRARAWLEAAGQAWALPEAEHAAVAARVRSLLGGEAKGLGLDPDLRWRALTALARLGALEDGELDAQLDTDPGASGITRHLLAVSSAPQEAAKEKVFSQALSDTSLSNDHIEALVAGFAVAGHQELTAPFTTRYLEALETLWSSRGQETATRIVLGLFPSCGDSRDLEAVERWLDTRPQAPAALRRLLLKGRDDLARALRAR